MSRCSLSVAALPRCRLLLPAAVSFRSFRPHDVNVVGCWLLVVGRWSFRSLVVVKFLYFIKLRALVCCCVETCFVHPLADP